MRGRRRFEVVSLLRLLGSLQVEDAKASMDRVLLVSLDSFECSDDQVKRASHILLTRSLTVKSTACADRVSLCVSLWTFVPLWSTACREDSTTETLRSTETHRDR